MQTITAPRWELRERAANRWAYIGFAWVMGWVCCQAYYHLPNLWEARQQLVKVETVQVPALKHEVVVEQKKAKRAEQEKNAIIRSVTGGEP